MHGLAGHRITLLQKFLPRGLAAASLTCTEHHQMLQRRRALAVELGGHILAEEITDAKQQ